MNDLPTALRRLADALDAEERAARALWEASRRAAGVREMANLREAYRAARETARIHREMLRERL